VKRILWDDDNYGAQSLDTPPTATGTESKQQTSILRSKLKPPDPFYVSQALAMETMDNNSSTQSPFDTDSGPVGIDNRCTACISHRIEDFIDTPVDSNRVIKGFAGSQTGGIKMGTLLWWWEDDQGQVHEHKIPGSFYVPQAKVRLLSPQHWMQQTASKQEKACGATSCTTFHDRLRLAWGGKYTRTVPLDQSNVATFHLAPGYSKFQAFCAEAGINDQLDDTLPMCVHSTESVEEEVPEPELRREPVEATFDLDGPPNGTTYTSEIDQSTPSDASAEFLRYHQRYAHIAPTKIKAMARRGILPARLATCPIPVCTACLYGKATKKPW
jgi:hypothetical protein